MSAHVIFNFLNELRKEIMRLVGHFITHNVFNKLNKAGARMLDSIYHIAFNSFEIAF